MAKASKLRVCNNKIFHLSYYCHSDGCKNINNSCCFKYYAGVSRYKRILIEKLFLNTRQSNFSKASIRRTHFSYFDKNGSANIKRDNRGCSFLYKDKNGFYRCRIHSLCLNKSLNPFRYKPVACINWPLIICKYNNTISLDIYKEFPLFPCSTDRRGIPLIIALRPQLEYILGKNKFQQLQRMQLEYSRR